MPTMTIRVNNGPPKTNLSLTNSVFAQSTQLLNFFAYASLSKSFRTVCQNLVASKLGVRHLCQNVSKVQIRVDVRRLSSVLFHLSQINFPTTTIHSRRQGRSLSQPALSENNSLTTAVHNRMQGPSLQFIIFIFQNIADNKSLVQQYQILKNVQSL